MENFKSVIIFLIVLITFANIGCNNKKYLEFRPLKPFSINEPKDGLPSTRTDYYLVRYFSEDDTNQIHRIDSFVLRNLPEKYEKHSLYQMLFYEYNSANMNENYKHDSHDLIEWKGEFLLFEYKWQNGKFMYSTLTNKNHRKTFFTLPSKKLTGTSIPL
jgi:hypothetical protein